MIEVIDDFLPKFIFDRVCLKVMNSEFPWTCVPTGHTTDSHFAFVHNISNYPNGEISELSEVVASYICEKFNLRVTQLRIIRFGLTHRESVYTIHKPHVDSIESHKVALLYLNNSDGDTIIYKERYTTGKMPFQNVNDLTVDQKITPKPNRLVFFDGDLYHSASTPVNNQLRYAINFNFATEHA